MPTFKQTIEYTFTGTEEDCEEYRQRLGEATEPVLDPLLRLAYDAGLSLEKRHIGLPTAEEE